MFGRSGEILGQAQLEITQSYPHSGWVEHDPEQIWASTLKVCTQAIANALIEAHQLSWQAVRIASPPKPLTRIN